MSDTILGGDFTIYYLDENRQKRIEWTGSATGTRTANELYSALQDWFDEQGQMDDGIPMSAQTPVEYTIGIIDSGDLDPWYISYRTMQHIRGGAIRTNGWTHVDSSAVGIIVVPVSTGGAIVQADVNKDISGATTGAGTLLEYISTATMDYLVIRPDDNTAAKQFTTNAQNITCNAHVSAQSGTVSNTGEQVWANLYSLGTIETDTHVYVYQGAAAGTPTARTRLTSITDATQDWWSDGHIDMCIYLRNFKTATYSVIDSGYATVYARKGNTLYDSYEVAASTTSGGKNPIPLGASTDLDNTTGYKSVTLSGASGNWTVGNEIKGATSLARGTITKITGSNPTPTLHYYLMDDPPNDFTGSETINNQDDTGTGAKDGATSAQGPALAAWFTSTTVPTISYTNTTADINNDSANEYYGITVNCQNNPLSQVYEWLKYITRQGATGTTLTNGIPGESYIGGDTYLAYSGAITGTVAEGNDVTQATSGATGIIISLDTTNKIVLLRNTRGTFNTANVITDNVGSGTFTPNTAAVTFAPKKASPIGTFAGGTFFGARGVLISNWLAADENKFQLTPVSGGTVTRPPAITIEVTNLSGGAETSIVHDRVAVFRLTGVGGSINKTEYSATGGESIGDGTITVDGAIAQDVPGKTSGGVLRIRDFSDDNKGYRVRYASWTGSIFTLAAYNFTAAASTTTTVIKKASGFNANVKRGDLVINVTQSNAISYVKSVDDDSTITLTTAITGQASGDSIKINGVPVAINTADDVYVPLIDKYATASSASVSIQYTAPIYFRVVVRNSAASTKILPFTTDDATSGTNRSIATIRTTDTIIV